MFDIYIACPAGLATGGPELLHQLCNVLDRNGFNAYMYYTNYVKGKNPVPDEYAGYNNRYVTQIDDNDQNIIVIPETMFDLYCKIKKCRKIFWWLSVDFFWHSVTPRWLRGVKKTIALLENKIGKNKVTVFMDETFMHVQKGVINKKINILKKDRRTFHLVQSKYAEEYCYSIGIDTDRVMYLSDYLNQGFLKSADSDNLIKENIVLYNPKKGWGFTQKIIEKADDICWMPLIGLTRNQMIDCLKKAKVYIDFGNHPGKDRIPREACVCRCIVITGRRGSANYFEDVPVDEAYKFNDTDDNINNIIKCIKDCFDNYDERKNDFDFYRKKIYMEKDKFENDVVKVFQRVIE